MTSELLDFQKSERVDHCSQNLSGDSGIKSSVRSNDFDSQKHFVLAPAVYNPYAVGPLELDDFADELSTLDEELRESSVDFIQLFSHVGQVVMTREVCHADHLDIDPTRPDPTRPDPTRPFVVEACLSKATSGWDRPVVGGSRIDSP